MRRDALQPAPPLPIPGGAPAGPVLPPRDIRVSRTSTGLVLLAVGVLVQSVPVASILGVLVGAVGAILMILGAPAFGKRHEQLVWASVVVYIAAEIVTFILAGSFASTVASQANASGPSAANAILGAFDGLLFGGIVASAMIGAAFVLIAYLLEDRIGQALLLAGVIIQIVVAIFVVVYILDPLVHAAITQAYASTPPDMTPISNADAQLHTIAAPLALDAIPSFVFAGAYLWAMHRVDRRVIPKPAPPTARTSKGVLAAILALVLVVSFGAVGSVASGLLATTPPPPPVWSTVASFNGTTTGATGDFTLTATQTWLNETLLAFGPVDFAFSVYASSGGAAAGTCSMGGGGGGPMAGACGGPGPGTYYIVVTNVTGVQTWRIDVVQYG